MPTNDEFLAVGGNLIEDDEDLDDNFVLGDLQLVRQGEAWQIYHVDQALGDSIQIYTDTIRPTQWASARILGGYLRWLDRLEPENVDLPDPSPDQTF